MLDHEFVERIEREMAENGGIVAADDHEGVWELLCVYSDSKDELEFAISMLTDRPITEVKRAARAEAARRNPGVSARAAIESELERLWRLA